MKRVHLLMVMALLLAGKSMAQLKISGEIRPRTELYNGNNTANPAIGGKSSGDNTPGLATQQRTRFTFTYTGEGDTKGLKIVFSPQLIHFWGQMPQAYDLLGDGAPGAPESNFSVFEAYAEYALTESFSLKFGRQAISYGDQRFLGALGWAASGRAHDAFVGKFKIGSSSLDAGFTLNSGFHRSEGAFDARVRSGNKSLQFAWFTPSISADISAPVMIVNETYQNLDSLGAFSGAHTNRTTAAIMPKIKLSDDLTLDGSFYYQFSGDTHAATLLAVNATYKVGKSSIGIGADIVSADDPNTDDKTENFRQPYGTNHKFYGFMDFFYVAPAGIEDRGLNDFFVKAKVPAGDKSALIAHVHYFTHPYATAENESGTLGQELDLIYNLNVSKAYNVKLGYSQFLADDNFNAVMADDFNNWVWLQLTAKF